MGHEGVKQDLSLWYLDSGKFAIDILIRNFFIAFPFILQLSFVLLPHEQCIGDAPELEFGWEISAESNEKHIEGAFKTTDGAQEV